MIAFTVRRTFIAIVLLFVVSAIVFSIVNMMPGDPARMILGRERNPNEETLKAVREKLGLDKPFLIRIQKSLWGMFRLDFGRSFRNDKSVSELIKITLPRTFYIVIGGVSLGVILGLSLGLIAAAYANTIVDRVVLAISTIGISTPVFVTGTLFMYLFALHFHWFPASGYVGPTEDFSAFIRRLSLPTLTLGISIMAAIARMLRSTMLEVVDKDYVRTARSKGLRERAVLIKHAMRNALIPVVSMIGIRFGSQFGRTVLIERLFNWPGMSTTLIRAALFRDYPVVQGIVLVVAAIFIFVNLITDLLYGYLDPRITYK